MIRDVGLEDRGSCQTRERGRLLSEPGAVASGFLSVPGAVATGSHVNEAKSDSSELPPRQPKRLPPLLNKEGSPEESEPGAVATGFRLRR